MLTKIDAKRLTDESLKKFVTQSKNVLTAMCAIEQKIQSTSCGSSTVEPKYSVDITKELGPLSHEEFSYVQEQLEKVHGYKLWYESRDGTYTIKWD